MISEKLTYDGELRLDRGKNGAGKIWAVKINDFIEFESPTDQLAARTRRDGIQHPFFNDLHDFANHLRHYQFGSPLGKDKLLLLPDINSIQYKNNEIIDTNEVVKLYTSAFEEFGEKFDSLVLEDFNSLGYNCSDVGAEYADSKIVKLQGAPVLWLFVQEKGLKSKTTQWTMSQGMFRALSLVIHINYCILRKLSGVVLIDDIGEGLDYSRSKSFIDLLIKKSEKITCN